MIVYSDNTATNLVLDKIGLKATADRMEAWGFPHTKLHAKVFRGSTTSVDKARTAANEGWRSLSDMAGGAQGAFLRSAIGDRAFR